jgi:multicomponent Na+:H+ antiporter subunit B
MKRVFPLVVLLALAMLLIWGIEFSSLPPRVITRYYINYGKEETGAVNLVSAIYLGYRAFDTFGETLVLLLAVFGVAMLFKKEEN